MCGIVGLLETRGAWASDSARARGEAMRDTLRHRGPDDAGLWLDPEGQVVLGHRRLSILDLSPSGHQPMASQDGRYWMVYNGEVYNFQELRRQLEQAGHSFQGTSDTEVLLAAFREWGLENTLPRLNGMFALALWDTQKRRLALARDRYGKKPLYYGRVGSAWAFASELKALRALPDFVGQVDPQALGEYFRLGYVPAPMTIYRGFKKLPPASYCWLSLSDPELQRYWCLEQQPGGLPEAGPDEVEQTLLRAVKLRMVSDVPLGAFLSGGIDSSLIVALMQEQSTHPIQTFCLGFRSDSHDEAGYARAVAAHLGTDHTEHYVTASEALEVVPQLAQIYDEPFADSSQIPNFLVSRLARQAVSVVLSGDGGDEVFGGYNRYLFAPRVWNILRRIPLPLRRALGLVLSRVPMSMVQPLLAGKIAYPHQKLTKLVHLLECADPGAIYRSLTSQWQQPEQVVAHFLPTPPHQHHWPDFVAGMMIEDGLTYLPDDILVKVDRASMAVSLEARAPFLDPEVTAAAWRLPCRQKIDQGQGKRILRQLLNKRFPERLFQRPKAGFSLPLGDWLKFELRDWAEAMLTDLGHSQYLHAGPVKKLWKEHQSGHRDWSAPLWTVLMFQAWLAG